jgi:hypothetical protein
LQKRASTAVIAVPQATQRRETGLRSLNSVLDDREVASVAAVVRRIARVDHEEALAVGGDVDDTRRVTIGSELALEEHDGLRRQELSTLHDLVASRLHARRRRPRARR